MAKIKSKINSKYKAAPKRKLVLGGLEDSPYLSKTNYQAQDAPTTMLQNQFDANEQRKAQQMTAIYGDQLARELDYLGDANAASEQRKQDEAKAAKEKQEAEKKKAASTIGTSSSKIGKDLLKSAIAPTLDYSQLNNSTNIFSSGNVASGAPLSPTVGPNVGAPGIEYSHLGQFQLNPASGSKLTSLNYSPSAQPSAVNQFMPQGLDQGVVNTSTNATNAATTAKTAGSMSGTAAAVTSLGFTAAAEGVDLWTKTRQNKIDKNRGYSQYYSDTHYTPREALGQMAESTLRGAGYGVSVGHAVPGIGEVVGGLTGATMGLAVGTGIAAKNLYDTKGVKVFGKQYGAKNKYDENLDPTVIEKRNSAAQLKAMTNTANAMENARMTSMTQSDLNTGFALKNSTFEAKYGGNIKYLKGGVAKSIGRGAVEYVGKKHEHGGIDLPGNIEVEGGETEQNDYVFSATLKLPNGATYAQAHKALIKSGATGEEIHQLALSQEAAAGRNPNQIKSMKFAKYGGPLQYNKGGEKPTLKERRKERLLNKFNKEYDAQIQELEGLPEDQIADKVNEMYKAFIKREGQLNYDIEDQKTFDKTDLAIDLFANTAAGTLGGAAGLGIGAPVGAGIGLGVGVAKALREYITSKRGTSRRLDKLEAQKAANINFENNLIYNPKGKLANKYVEAYLKENPYISNAKDFNYIEDTIYSPTEFDGYNLATTQAADNYFKSREEEKQAALKNPPVPIKGKDAGKLSRTATPKLVSYNLPSINPGPTVTTFVPDEEPVVQNQVTAAIANSGLSTEEFAKQTGVDPEVIKGIQAGTINLNPDEQAMLLAAIPSAPAVTANTTATNPPVTTQTNNPPVTNTNMPTTTYTTAGKAITTPTTDGKPRFFMGASRIVDENGNVQILTDRPLMGTGAMSGSRLGTPGAEGLSNVQNNSYAQAAGLKINAEYVNTKDVNSGGLSSSNAVADREKIAGTDWGKRWGYKPGMSEKEAKAAHDAFATEMRTKFDQSPEEMLGYYQYLIDNPNEYGKDADQIKANLKAKGFIGEDGKIKQDALSYLKTQATNEFVGPIHNAAGAYSLKGRPTPVKIPGDTPKDDISIPPPPKKDYSIDIPPPPTYTRTKSTNGLGLIQTIPAAAALTNNIKTQDINPSLTSSYVQPGAIGRVNLGRISYNAERASNQANNAAMNQALQNMSGPGAVAGMMAAKTKADQQALQIAQAEQNTNMGRAGEEAKINTGISQFNVGQAMAAQQARANIDQANAGRMQQANQFNTQVKYARDVENREQRLGALDRGAQAITMNALANRQIDATENLAMVQDYTNAYKRYLETIAPTLGSTTKTTEEEPKTKAKFGGVKKYVSRLGDLKNNRTFKA